MMNIDEAIKHEEIIADACKGQANMCDLNDPYARKVAYENGKCAEMHKQIAEWLKELRVFKSRRGQWLRMSDLSEQEDDRYKCSHCGNVVRFEDSMDLYTFNSWCGRCGSDNGREIEMKV